LRLRRVAAAGGVNMLAFTALRAGSFLVGLWAADLLGTREFGALQMVRVIFGYAAFLSLGVMQAVMLELPVSLGEGDMDEVRRVRGQLASALVLGLVLASAACVGLEVSGLPLNGVAVRGLWLLIGLVIAVSTWASFSQLIFRSYEQFGRLAAHRFVYAGAFVVAAPLFLWLWGLRGMLAGLAAAYSVQAVFGLALQFDKLAWHWRVSRWWRYVKYGLPIRLNTFLWLLVTSVDLWLVSAYLGPEAAGTYGFAMLLASGFRLAPAVLSEMAHPRIAKAFGESGRDIDSVRGHLFLYTAGSAAVFVLPAAFLLAAFSGLIDHWLVKFEDAKLPLAILLAGHLVNRSSHMAGTVTILARKQKQVTVILAITLALAAMLDVLVLTTIGSLWAVAAATSLCLVAESIALLVLAVRVTGGSGGQLSWIVRTAVYLLTGCAGLLGVTIIDRYFDGPAGTAVAIAVAVALGAPLALCGARHLKRYWEPAQPGVPDER